VSKDGLSLYFHSNRSGNNDIYVSQRGNRNEPWGPPVNLGTAVNSTAGDAEATLSRDEHWLFFNSSRGGGNLDIWVSYREHTHDDFDWQPAVNVGQGVNSIAVDTGAAYFENDDTGAPQLLFSSNRPGGLGLFDLYSSELLPDGTFGPAVVIAELSSTFSEPGLSIRFDGLEVFFFSGRLPSQGGLDLWSATRKSVLDPWSAPINLGSINTAAGDVQPHIAPDRETLYFTSNREGGVGGMDLYVTTRSKEKE
jgi:WD40-like Beta Propeller Repeat